jgi:hypothetical protein
MMMMLALFLLLPITRGSALSGRFVRQPEPGTAGSPLSPAIEVTATPAANLTGARVVLQLGDGSPAGAQLLGQAWAPINSSGVADFGAAQLRSNVAGANYTLDAFLLDEGRIDAMLDPHLPYPAVGLFQQIDTRGTRDVTAFAAGGRTFLAVANYKDGKSDVYVMNGNETAFELFQQIDMGTRSPHGVDAFSVGGRTFLAVANTEDGSNQNIKSDVYVMNGNLTAFVLFQQIDTHSARGMAAISVAGRTFLGVANFHSGSSPSIESDVDVMNGDQTAFVLFQKIDTHGAFSMAAFTAGDHTYLAVANHVNHKCGGECYNIESVIYRMKGNGTAFERFQAIDTHGATYMAAFSDGGRTFLGVPNYRDGSNFNIKSDVYVMNGNQTAFELFQQIDTRGARSMTAFTMGGRVYLAVANNGGLSGKNLKSDVYAMNGDQTAFELFQQIDTHGAYAMAAVSVGDRTFLAVANNYDGSSYNIKSDLYVTGLPLLATSAPFELAAGAAARLDGGAWRASKNPVANEALQPPISVALVDECTRAPPCLLGLLPPAPLLARPLTAPSRPTPFPYPPPQSAIPCRRAPAPPSSCA